MRVRVRRTIPVLVAAAAIVALVSAAGGAQEDHPPPDAEGAFDVAVAPDGSVWVVGQTRSVDFPTRRAWQPAAAGGLDAFVVRLRPGGRGILFATYLGGADDDRAYSVAVDEEGYGYVSGTTRSADFPTRRPLQPAAGGQADAFLVKLAPRGDVVYSTYLGGRRDEGVAFVSVDARHRPILAGVTRSRDFPTARPMQPEHGGGADAFVATLSRRGAVRWTTRLAGSGGDLATSLARGPSGELWAMGRTTSPDFPVREAIQPEFGGHYDVWVARLAATGELERSTYLGGADIDFGLMLGDAIVVDDRGRVTMIGKTDGTDFPALRAVQSESGGGYYAWVGRIDPEDNRLMFSTYLGGGGHEFGLAAALDRRGRAWLVGKTGSPDFPVRNPLQRALAGDYDVWVARLARGGQRLTFSSFLGGSR